MNSIPTIWGGHRLDNEKVERNFMIQIRRLRAIPSSNHTSEVKIIDKCFSPDILVPDVKYLFENIDSIVDKIPENERFNCYYTLSDSEGPRRTFSRQCVVPFDIDNIEVKEELFPKYIEVLTQAIKANKENCSVIFSGNGLQIVVFIDYAFDEEKQFKENKLFYGVICNKINKALEENNLQGHADPVVFSPNRIFRLPKTLNKKKNKPERMARILHLGTGNIRYNLHKISGIPVIHKKDQVTDRELKAGGIDTQAVLGQCDFLKWCRECQEEVSEPQWYALLSITGRLKNGQEISHAYSSEHPAYNEADTDAKINQAITASNPRTCENISTLWDGCGTCRHNGRVTSPICIRGEGFIATEETGFYTISPQGNLRPAYEDLRRYLEKEHPYIVNATSGIPYFYSDTHYDAWTRIELKEYAAKHFKPKPEERYANDFIGWVTRENTRRSEWFARSIDGYINFRNGILHIESRTMESHEPKLPFLYCLPFDYDPSATCPKFDRFMEEITGGDSQKELNLLQYMGYAICDRTYFRKEALLIVGDGSNGKTTFLEVFKALAGRGNYSSLGFDDLQRDTGCFHLEGKLVNISDEMPNFPIKNSEKFKKLMGGEIMAKKLYHDSYTIVNSAKFVFACNEIPLMVDKSEGMRRRLLIIPLVEKFDVATGNDNPYILEDLKKELSGIFNRIFEAFLLLKKEGRFAPCEAAEEAKEDHIEASDREGSWIKNNLRIFEDVKDEDNAIEYQQIFSHYVNDMKRNEEKPATNFLFGLAMKRIIPDYKARRIRKAVGDKKPYIICGVKMLSENNSD